ncbi:MAG: LptF/LptG family permease [Candidatus Omnitrophica bacterium]|nr:LptF/LptG family permease [Candidatus Omnitrophota bacterium]
MILFSVIQILDDLYSFIKGEKIFMLKNYLYTCPLLFVQISPIITILSLMLILSEMIKNYELKVFLISGVKPINIFYIFLFCGFFSAIITFSVKNSISPYFLKRINGQISRIPIAFTSHNYFFYAEKVEGKKFINVEFSEYYEEGGFRTFKIEIAENYDGNVWIFKDGFLWEFDKEKNLINKEKIDVKKVNIPLTYEILSVLNIDIETFSFFQLLRVIKKMEKLGLKPVTLISCLYDKIAYPFLNFFIVFVIYTFLRKREKISNLYVFSFSFLFSFFIYFLYILTFSLSKNAKIPPILGTWIIQIILLAHFFYQIKNFE